MNAEWQPADGIHIDDHVHMSTAMASCTCTELAGGVFSHVIASPRSPEDPGVLTPKQIEIFNASVDRHIEGHNEHLESLTRIQGPCNIRIIYQRALSPANSIAV